MTALLGQTMMVDNKAGAAGSIGAVEVKNAKPDGYTLLFATSSTHAINPTAFVKPLYDPIKDFTPISSICVNPLVLVAHPVDAGHGDGTGRADEEESRQVFLRLVGHRQHPSSRRASTSSARSAAWTSCTCPTRARAPALQDMMSGKVAWMFETFSTTLQLHRAGQGPHPRLRPCQARADRTRDPDHDRGRRAGLRGLHLQPDPGPGRHAAGRSSTRSTRRRAS